MLIKSIAEWHLLARNLSEYGYTRFQWQYDVDCPEGFRARFFCQGKQIIEVVTYSAEVKDAIFAYQL